MSQDALVQAMRAGDEAAFSRAVRDFSPSMLAAIRGLCDTSTAEDVIQESWLRVIQAIHGFEGRATLKTWLCSIALNEARQRLRKSRREITADLATADASPLADRFTPDGAWRVPPSPWTDQALEGLLERDSLQRCLDKHIAALGENQRSVLAMRDLQQMPVEDICNILQVSHSNFRVLLHRARSRLFAMIDHYMETGEC